MPTPNTEGHVRARIDVSVPALVTPQECIYPTPLIIFEVIDVAEKLRAIAEGKLEKGDKIEKTYIGSLDGRYGYLVLSNKKLLFVHEAGFLRKTYDLVLDLPYEKISSISQAGTHKLEIAEAEGRKHDFQTDLNVSLIEKSLKELMQ